MSSAELFGISTPGKLGSRNEIIDHSEYFRKMVIMPYQDEMLPVFNKLVSLKFGKPVKYEITPLSIYEVGNVNQTPQDANPAPPPVNKQKSPEPKYPNLNQTN